MFVNKQDYTRAITALEPVLENLPGKIIAIGGLPGSGKTTLGRHLACYFNVSLIETDLFLIAGEGKFIYNADWIDHLIAARLKKPRPVLIEGAVVLRLLSELGRTPDFIIHVSVEEPPKDEPSEDDAPEDDPLTVELERYEAEFTPSSVANLNLKLPKLIDEVP